MNGYEKSLATINSMRKNKKFQQFLEDERKKDDASLISYLILPVQRIPRCVLVLTHSV